MPSRDDHALFYSRVRLQIMSLLLAEGAYDFVALRQALGCTDGNLSTHLSRLEKAGMLRRDKRFVGAKPQTTVALSAAGKRAFTAFVDDLHDILGDSSGADASQ
ncbi:MAG: transcriptional regulator [Planctomycetota bacterium]